MNNIEIRRGNLKEIDEVEPLWERLKHLHYGLSPHFKERYSTMTWRERKQGLLEQAQVVLFDYAIDTAENRMIGYCISTIKKEGRTGEIDSIFVDERYRKGGVGKKMVENALLWFDAEGVEKQLGSSSVKFIFT